jgi:hypothetical protein
MVTRREFVSDREWLADRFEAERPQLRRVAYRMLGTLDEADAARQGDFDALIEILDPEVVLRGDAGPDSPFTIPPIKGAEAVIQAALTGARSGRPVRPALVNGAPGAIIGEPDRPFAVVNFTVSGGRIIELDFILDPAKLARITRDHGGTL